VNELVSCLSRQQLSGCAFFRIETISETRATQRWTVIDIRKGDLKTNDKLINYDANYNHARQHLRKKNQT
jgi:hypothetical protein